MYLTIKATGGTGNFCLAQSSSDSRGLILATCDATNARQLFSFVNSQIYVATGGCMDVLYANPAAGTRVQLYTCRFNQNDSLRPA